MLQICFNMSYFTILTPSDLTSFGHLPRKGGGK